ncbi:hypothetical protein VHEMI01635 [[Torrubiella] hemipterigena]|nr:hypothetical protein VHEMI01635 [[Torrubiella] hemipterigena]
MLRHRRRCVTISKEARRQRACDQCAQWKVKCCYSRPRCFQCNKRGIACTWHVGKRKFEPLHPEPVVDASAESATSMTSHSPPSTFSLGQQDAGWSMNMPSIVMPSAEISISGAPSDELVPWRMGSPAEMLFDEELIGYNKDPPSLALLSDPQEPLQDASTDTMANDNTSRSIISQGQIQLAQYPTLLQQDGFECPFIHRKLFQHGIADMAMLSHTAVAICCAAGLSSNNENQFVRHAIEAKRQMLINAYPDYYCIDQWDALHAMFIYEVLQWDASVTDNGDWRCKSTGNGLKSPFVTKMTMYYLEAHIATIMAADMAMDISWTDWAVAETARRTMFLANMVNFLSNRNSETGKQSPYYEPFDSEQILNLTLPCSHALWNARTEAEWRALMQEEADSSKAQAQTQGTGGVQSSAIPVNITLQKVLSEANWDEPESSTITELGFTNVDSLRSLIVLCAKAQFEPIFKKSTHG